MDEEKIDREKAMEDLGTIRSFFEEGQKCLGDTGFHFMLWGALIPAATAVFYLLLHLFGPKPAIIAAFWPAVCVCGAAVSCVVGARSGRVASAKSYALKINSLLWFGFFGSMAVIFLIQFIGSGAVTPTFLSWIALVLGLAYWVHGAMLQLSWFRVVTLGWWAGAVAMAGKDWFQASLIMSGATFICSFVPGLILFRKKLTRGR